MQKNWMVAVLSCGVFGLSAMFTSARPIPAGPSEPVELGVWHSDLVAATAKAKELGVPMLVVWGDPDCSYCTDFDTYYLDNPIFKTYIEGRGLVLVYEKSAPSPKTAIRLWVGTGDWPLLRVTWWKKGQSSAFVDSEAGGWDRPNSQKKKFDTYFPKFQAKLESYISAYSAVPADTSKDAYDPANDGSAGATLLTWRDQTVTESLRLANKAEAPVYSDREDWFKWAVVTGATYQIWVSGVSGVSTDVPRIAVFGNAAGTEVIGDETTLANGNYEFEAVENGFVYVRVKRATGADAAILYSLNYRRWAPGRVEFTAATKTVSESSGSVTLTLRRVNGTSGAASVRVRFADSGTADSGFTATSGQDFTGTERVIAWADGDAADKSFSVTLIKDEVVWEGNETFGVTLEPKDSPDLTVGPAAAVTIQEADAMVISAGNYSGWAGELYLSGVEGTFTMSVNAQGVMSGRVVFPQGAAPYSGAYTLVSMTYDTIIDGVASISGALAKSGAANIPLQLQVTLANGDTVGSIGADGEEMPVELYLDRWATAEKKAIANQLAGYYTVAFPVLVPMPGDAPVGIGFASITLDNKGRFKAAGKLGDGTTFAQSGVLFVKQDAADNTNVCALLYSAPTTYRGGRFAGVIRFGDVNGNGTNDVSLLDDSVFIWKNLNPASVPAYDDMDPGFESTLTATGGWYNKLMNLAAYYQGRTLFVGDLAEPPVLPYTVSVKVLNENNRAVTERVPDEMAATSWQSTSNVLVVTPLANGSGFSVPKADLKLLGKDADGVPAYNYDSAVNPNGLTVKFNRATGVMAGGFKVYYDYASAIDATGDEEVVTKWAHTVKQATYQSVLLPERPDLQDGIEGGGFYLFPGKGLNETGATPRSYSFNYSFEFLLTAETE